MPEIDQKNMGGALGTKEAVAIKTPEELRKIALDKREAEAKKIEQAATFDLTNAGAVDEESSEVPESKDGTSLVNKPAHKISSESDRYQMENVTLKQELARKDARIEDLESQLVNTNRALQIARDESVKQSQLDELMAMLAANPDRDGEFLVIVPNDSFESSFGYKDSGAKNFKGDPIMVPNRWKFVKGRPMKVPKAIYENLKHAGKLQGIQ
jgi:hypothetical protein